MVRDKVALPCQAKRYQFNNYIQNIVLRGAVFMLYNENFKNNIFLLNNGEKNGIIYVC